VDGHPIAHPGEPARDRGADSTGRSCHENVPTRLCWGGLHGRIIASVESREMTVIVITGATRGIGRAAAVELARGGAEIVVVGRERERVEAVAREAQAAGGRAPVHTHVADLTLMAEVRALAAVLHEQHERIDVLANNAGAMFASRKLTSEGLERTFALNHLAPFLLTHQLRDLLAGGRVVTTASDAHKAGRLDLDDLQSERSYAAMRVYGTTKLCNILFTRELAKRAPELNANCFHPGVVRTGFGKNDGGIWKVLTTIAGPFARSPERGARSLVWLATSAAGGQLTAAYVQDEKEVDPSSSARDPELAAGLWERSAALVGLGADRVA
jgi:NAD(P)-dependent dehydrogenase (short-subunit alcohol dehydrogenase family)